jgi:hypothetical protein
MLSDEDKDVSDTELTAEEIPMRLKHYPTQNLQELMAYQWTFISFFGVRLKMLL